MPPMTYAFEWDRAFVPLARLFAVAPDNCGVTIVNGQIDARFGPWHVCTPVSNVVRAEITGPYWLIRTAGPARLTFRDRGLTFATNRRRGVELHFAEPIPGIEPTGTLRHPNLTLTLADCEGFADAVTR